MSKRNSNRIVVIQFICTILIVIQHGTNLIPWNLYFTNYKWAIFFEEFIEHITHIAVPVFFYFSGYLMFVNFNYIRKIKKRLYSLVIPYVLWNLICALFLIGVEQISFLQHKINRPKEQLSFNLLKEIWLDCSFNGPLWYLRNLIIISLLSIIIYYLLYQTVLGQIIIIGCCIFNLINNFNYYGIVYWMPEYLMGAYVAIHGLPRIYPIYGEESLFSYILNKKKNWFIVFSAILLGVIALISFIINDYRTMFAYRLLSALLFPFIISNVVFSENDFNWKYKVTMFIYCSHFTITTIISKIFLIMFGVSIFSAIVSCILCPIFTLIIVYFIIYFCAKHMKTLWKLLSGGRKVEI